MAGQPGTRCAAHKCLETNTQFIRLGWWCPKHEPADETPQPNCGHINVITVYPRTLCSWCAGTIRRLD